MTVASNAKASGTPLLIAPDGAQMRLERIGLAEGHYNEDWLKALAFNHPEILPITDIEPGFGRIVAVVREVPCAHGYIDNLYVTPCGDLVLVEAKLWRNPQARREVVAQALDYVSALMSMGYEAFEQSCRKGQGMAASSMHALVADLPDALNEAEFIDAVSRNLVRGRMLVIALGDGIRSETEALAGLLQSHAGAHFTFALVELTPWRNPQTGDIIAVPGTLARTAMIMRGIVGIENGVAHVKPVAPAAKARVSTISDELFFEELTKRDPHLPDQLSAFLTRLEPLGIYGDLKASMNLKIDLPGAAKPMNFGYVTKGGKLWTDALSWTVPQEIACQYNSTLAAMIGGQMAFTSDSHSYVSTNGKSAPRLSQLLPEHADGWAEAIATAVTALQQRDDDHA